MAKVPKTGKNRKMPILRKGKIELVSREKLRRARKLGRAKSIKETVDLELPIVFGDTWKILRKYDKLGNMAKEGDARAEPYVRFMTLLDYGSLIKGEKHIEKLRAVVEADIKKTGSETGLKMVKFLRPSAYQGEIRGLEQIMKTIIESNVFGRERAAALAREFLRKQYTLGRETGMLDMASFLGECIREAKTGLEKRHYVNKSSYREIENYMSDCEKFGGVGIVEDYANGWGFGDPTIKPGTVVAIPSAEEEREHILLTPVKDIVGNWFGVTAPKPEPAVDVEKQQEIIRFIEVRRANLLRGLMQP